MTAGPGDDRTPADDDTAAPAGKVDPPVPAPEGTGTWGGEGGAGDYRGGPVASEGPPEGTPEVM
jgi:hypothetical protein